MVFASRASLETLQVASRTPIPKRIDWLLDFVLAALFRYLLLPVRRKLAPYDTQGHVASAISIILVLVLG